MQPQSIISESPAAHLAPVKAPSSGTSSGLAHCIPRLTSMSEQLVQTSAKIEDSIVEVCHSFQAIADRATAGAQRVSALLGGDDRVRLSERSFEGLLQSCANTMLKLLDASVESARITARAVERIEGIDKASRQITSALGRLDMISSGNKILALNARIEAAHSDTHGVGFAAVAVELSLQTDRSREVTAQLAELTESLRTLAQSTVGDLQHMQAEDNRRSRRSRAEVDETLLELRTAHKQMEQMLSDTTAESNVLAKDIGAAVRGLQFQDRVSQRLAHVVEDLAVIKARVAAHVGTGGHHNILVDQGFSGQSMREEHEIYGAGDDAVHTGDIELF